MAEEPKQDATVNEPEPILLDAKQAAAMLGIGRAHLYALHSSGRLPMPIHLGRRTLWRADELKDWVKANCPNRQRWLAIKGTKK